MAGSHVPMPDVGTMRVCVLYDSVNIEDAWMLWSTFPSVVRRFPDALEAVVVVRDELARSVYLEVLGEYEANAPFPLRVVVVTGMSETSSSLPWLSSLRGDEYCSGRFVLHLEVDSLLLERVTYDTFFHLGKPVIPFKRSSEEGEHSKYHVVIRTRCKAASQLHCSRLPK